MGGFFYSTPDNAVLEDLSLTPTEYRVYNYLKKLADLTYSPRLKAGDSSIYNAAGLLWSYCVYANG